MKGHVLFRWLFLQPRVWVGIVAIGDIALVTAPADRVAQRLRAALADLPISALTDVAQLETVLSIAEVLGPATLANVAAEEFRARDTDDEDIPADHNDIAQPVTDVKYEEAREKRLGFR